MKAITLTLDDLRGFLDTDERQPTNEELDKINYWYEVFCSNADVGEEEDYLFNYNGEGYYPPFVAQSVSLII